MKEVTLALLMWINSNTPLAYQDQDLPEIVSADQEQLVRLMYEGDVPQGLDVDSITVDGLYNHRDDKIYLHEKLDLAAPEGRAVLVHELVHYLQYQQGLEKVVPCMRKLEPAAYAAQGKYLEQHNKQAPFNQLHVLLVSMCTEHPM
ncbi:MAG: DUF6647 family protein [Acidiferrobacterales bacterium]|nr:DUF6647 family protein [Acidiferrobacterales bacterium]